MFNTFRFFAPRPQKGPGIVFAAILALAALGLGSCAAPPVKPTPPPKLKQEISFRVMNLDQMPLSGAVIEITPRLGRPAGPSRLVTGPQGVVKFFWLPKGSDEAATIGSKDTLFTFDTDFYYAVKKPGYLDSLGRVKMFSRGQGLTTPELSHMSRAPVLRKHEENVPLRLRRQLIGGELAGLPESHPAVAGCLEFWRLYAQQTRRLNLRFADPAFILQKGLFTARMRWREHVDADMDEQRKQAGQIKEVGELVPVKTKAAAPATGAAGSAGAPPAPASEGPTSASPAPAPGGKPAGPGGSLAQGGGHVAIGPQGGPAGKPGPKAPPQKKLAPGQAPPLPPKPLQDRVALKLGLPMAMILANSALAASGAKTLKLVFVCELVNPKDVYAEPEVKTVVMQAPAAKARDLARGRLAALKFLRDYPPKLVK